MSQKEQDARVDGQPKSEGRPTAASNKPTHTPGPWKNINPYGGWISTVGDPYGSGPMHIADVRGWGHLTGKGGGCAFDEDKAVAIQEANARLIAAAPTMLDALKALTERYVSLVASGDCGNWDVEDEQFVVAARAAIAKAEGREP